MPRISRFYGITIFIWYDEPEHEGRPHFHANYGGQWASFLIDPPQLLAGELPPRASRLVSDWAEERRGELLANWNRARRHEPLVQVPPLS